MTPLGQMLTMVLVVLVLCLPRGTAAVGIIATVCFITEGQVVKVGVLHFTAIRIVLLAGLIRVLARGESSQVRFNEVDGALVAYACAIGTISTLRVATVEQLVYELGSVYNIFLAYLVFRCLLRDERDLRGVLRVSVLLIVPLASLILCQSLTNSNPFSAFGDVGNSAELRDGQVRSQGPFHSPSTAGAFGMTFAMLYGSSIFAGHRTRLMLTGLVTSVLIMIFAHASGPFLGFALGLLALACWPLRRHTRTIRWAILATVIGLDLVMKAPVWFVIARVSDWVGGDGYHRAELIDQFVNHFGSWWLIGMSDTRDWFGYHLAVNGQADITNAFVQAGISGGLVGLILYIVLIVRCFQRLGVAMKRNRRNQPATERMLWGVGSGVVGSIGVLLSVCYFDQMQVIWYFLLAYIAGVEIRQHQVPAHYGELKRSLAARLAGGHQS